MEENSSGDIMSRLLSTADSIIQRSHIRLSNNVINMSIVTHACIRVPTYQDLPHRPVRYTGDSTDTGHDKYIHVQNYRENNL